MPLSKLYCEGEDQGFDVRLLSCLLRAAQPGLAVEAYGGKDGLPRAVVNDRRRGVRSAAIRDADFPRAEDEAWPASGAWVWKATVSNQEHLIGWTWRRKEIENYLLAEEVLSSALQWSADQTLAYRQVLHDLFQQLSVCTAGRMALVIHAPRKKRVDTNLPSALDEASLRQTLHERAAAYNQHTTIHSALLLQTFDRLLPRCRPGGDVFSRAAERFAGKDLFSRLQEQPGLAAIDRRLKSRGQLEDAVIDGMDLAGTKVLDWLPEWRSLHEAVENWTLPSAA